MILFHRTAGETARVILTNGFKDSTGSVDGRHYRGVWLSERPYPAGGLGDFLLEVALDIPDAEIAKYTWFNGPLRGKQMVVPSAVINEHGTVRPVTELLE